MTRPSCALVAVVLVACVGDPGRASHPKPSSVATSTPAPSALPPRAASAQLGSMRVVGPVGKPYPPPPLPVWLDPDYNDSTAPFRARLTRNPRLYGDERNEALNDPRPGESSRVELVFEEPKTRDSARVRLLCQSSRERVALYVDRDALALRTRLGALIAARQEDVEAAMAAPESFAGFESNAGIDVGAKRSDAGTVLKVTYGGDRVKVSGFVSRSQLDEVWEWPVGLKRISANAKIPRDATVLDAPRGKAFARLEALPDGGYYEADAQPPNPDRSVFVRVRTHDGTLSGWIPESKLQRDFNGGSGRLGSGHSTRGPVQNPIELPKGTLFYAGDEPIGVVKNDGKFECVRGCTDPRPVVKVWACGEQVELVARYASERASSAK